MLRYTALVIFVSLQMVGYTQSVKIPANTGYAIPAEKDESDLFNDKNGLQGWADTKQQIQYFFYLRNTGKLSIDIYVKNNNASNKISVSFKGKSFPVMVPHSQLFKKVHVASVTVTDTGFYTLTLSASVKKGKTIADIQSIELNGAAVTNIHFNPKSRRNAASVHLKYPIPDTGKVVAFYNEVTIPEGADPIHTYYMACGFARGYFGIQVNSLTERRVIFSVWDAGKEAVDRNKVADSNKVQLLAKGDGVFADGFGNEGTGGHSHWVYPWQTGKTYQFLVTALTDSIAHATIYTGYFFVPDLQKWKLIASFKAPHDGKYLRSLYSFNENFDGINGQLQRKSFFGNQWIQQENGKWTELTQSNFSYDATGKAGDRIDYGAGIDVNSNAFYLWNGGFQPANTHFGELFTRNPGGKRPLIDWSKNVDSLQQASIDKQMILSAIASGKIDTTGTKDGVYYQILKEGTGEYVSVNDTVTVFYKGSLLADGTVFDQTKEKPASFPLKRLIKGWQLALPVCKVGGKIQIIIPSGLAYTIRSRSKDIPPNSVLVFTIEILSAKK